jgi:hypothetical protein
MPKSEVVQTIAFGKAPGNMMNKKNTSSEVVQRIAFGVSPKCCSWELSPDTPCFSKARDFHNRYLLRSFQTPLFFFQIQSDAKVHTNRLSLTTLVNIEQGRPLSQQSTDPVTQVADPLGQADDPPSQDHPSSSPTSQSAQQESSHTLSPISVA